MRMRFVIDAAASLAGAGTDLHIPLGPAAQPGTAAARCFSANAIEMTRVVVLVIVVS